MIDWRAVLFLFIALADLSILLMATDYGLDIWTGGSPITADQYGEAIYEIPAVVWAAFQGGGAVLGMIGAVMVAASDRDKPFAARGRIGALLCALGNMALTTMFIVFAFLSRDAAAGILMHSLNKFPGSLIFGGITVLALRLVIWGDENAGPVDR